MMIRQGDVLLVSVSPDKSALEPAPKDARGLVLAEGETSGHHHAVFGKGARLCRYKKERLGERIRRKRAEHKLGLRETATKVGISPTYLSRIETKKTPPAEDVIRKLATLLNDDFDELMQLAGRVPEDVERVIKGDPSMPAFLRTAKEQKLSGDDIMKLIEAVLTVDERRSTLSRTRRSGA